MPNTKYVKAILLSLLLGALLSACGRDEDQPVSEVAAVPPPATSPLLAHIAAETPYYFASSDTMSATQVLELIRRSGSNSNSTLTMLRSAAEQDDTEAEPFLKFLIALLEDVGDLGDPASFAAIGARPDANAAIYGVGLVPVMRSELADEQRFEAFLKRNLERSPQPFVEAEMRGARYWQTSIKDAPAQVLIGVHQQQLIIALLPVDAEQSLLAEILGLEMPAQSLADSGELHALEQRHGFTPYGAGFVSTARIFNALRHPDPRVGSKLTDDALEAARQLETCSDDIARIQTRMPGLVFGFSELNPGLIESRLVVLTDQEIVEDLRRLVARVPGMGAPGKLASMGLGLNLSALSSSANKYADQVRSQPFACEGLAPLNTLWAELGQTMNNPALFMVAPAFSGLRVQVDALSASSIEDYSADLMLLIASPAAEGLVSMASGFVPGIEAMNLRPGEAPRPVPADLLPDEAPPLMAAMSGNAILLASGDVSADEMKAALSAPLDSNEYLLHFQVTGTLYQRILQIIDSSGAALDSEQAAYLRDTLSESARIYRNSSGWLRANPHGLELGSRVELN